MVSALFEPEISSLESQVAALQATIAAAQQRITALSDCEAETDGVLQALTSAVQKVSALAPSALATLKSAVFALFSDGNGNQPITPAPQPQPDLGDSGREMNQDKLDSLHLNSGLSLPTSGVFKGCPVYPDIVVGLDGSSLPLCSLLEDRPTESLQGQSVELCCYWEDCPESSLLGQSVKIACLLGYHDILCEGEVLEAPAGYQYKGSDSSGLPTRMVVVEEPSQEREKNLFNLIPVSATVAYMKKIDGEITCVYAGFNNKSKAKQWGEWLAVHHSVASGFEVRESKRLTNYKHEVKLWGMSLKQIERLAGCDLMKSPPSNYGDAPKRPVERVPSMLEIEGIGVGDTVRSITVKNWQYKVTKIDSDNFLVCDRIGTNPVITQVLHPGSVELVTKADIVDVAKQELAEYLEQQAQSITGAIDSTDVPRGVILRQTTDDFIVEFNVFAWVIVRNQGVPEPQQRQIGRLVEGLGSIESYRPKAGIYHAFTRTMDAVNYLISGSGYSQSNIDAGVALFESRQHSVLVGAGASAQQALEVEF